MDGALPSPLVSREKCPPCFLFCLFPVLLSSKLSHWLGKGERGSLKGLVIGRLLNLKGQVISGRGCNLRKVQFIIPKSRCVAWSDKARALPVRQCSG
jgi:hypothetical protein